MTVLINKTFEVLFNWMVAQFPRKIPPKSEKRHSQIVKFNNSGPWYVHAILTNVLDLLGSNTLARTPKTILRPMVLSLVGVDWLPA